MIKYQNNFPYENRAGQAQLVMHPDERTYERAYRYRSLLPTKALYYVTRVLATRKFANNVAELRDGVDQVYQANETFKFYTFKEWVFDNANCQKLEVFLQKGTSSEVVAA